VLPLLIFAIVCWYVLVLWTDQASLEGSSNWVGNVRLSQVCEDHQAW